VGKTGRRILSAALADEAHAWERLGYLTDTFGNRFSGSQSLENAIDWILKQMSADVLSNVRGEPVAVPHWVRGAETLELLEPVHRSLPVLGLGDSVGTLKEGLTAGVLVVSSFHDLHRKAAAARGMIVVWNVPFTEYNQTVAYRHRGAIEAARVGAVASLVRSVTPRSLRTPHTGGMGYDPNVDRIPGAAITVEDAEMLQRMQDRGTTPVVRLKMNDVQLPDAPSRNVVAEIPGREHPEQVVVMGGHIDSWDVGTGAMDDGGGAVAAWEAARVIQQLELKPRRTIRVVLWTNEENGLRGGRTYRDAHLAEMANHVAAIESDNGAFRPLGFRFTGSEEALPLAQSIGPLLAPLDADSILPGEGEADISPLLERGVPGFSLAVDGTPYFWYHHTEADTLDKLNPHDLARCVAAMAVLAYALAEMPERLPQATPGKVE
jgi:carboxypeptidase Q